MNFMDWTMRDGRVVNIKTMSTLHIQKCVSMLKNNIELREKHRPMIKSIQTIVYALEKTKHKNESMELSNILDQADTDLMIAETLLDDQQVFSQNWIKAFEAELYLRESN